MKRTFAIVSAAAIYCLSVVPGAVEAQAAKAAPTAPVPRQGTGDRSPAPGSEAMQGDPDADSIGNFHPVLHVTSIEVIRSARPPELDIVHVKGLSSTEGWSDPQLVPLTRGPSADGVLDMVLIAQAPAEGVTPGAFGSLEATFTIEPGHPYKGVRVHGATNAVALSKLPGYVEVPAPVGDCNACEGKIFVAKGAAVPAGKGEASVVREEALPSTLRVIKATDGIRKFDIDPNRLTLLLGDNGVIVFAVWD